MPFFQILWLLGINILAWFMIHLIVSVGLLYLTPEQLGRDSSLNRLFRLYAFERDGELYQSFFKVKKWKDKVPDGASLFNLGYKKKQLTSKNESALSEFIMETKRAELTHWLILLPAPLFMLWNPWWAALINILYALMINLPFILIQRYNRPRLERIKRIRTNMERTHRQIENKIRGESDNDPI